MSYLVWQQWLYMAAATPWRSAPWCSHAICVWLLHFVCQQGSAGAGRGAACLGLAAAWCHAVSAACTGAAGVRQRTHVQHSPCMQAELTCSSSACVRRGFDMLGTATNGAGLSSGGSAVAHPPPGPKQHVPRRHSLCAAVSACAAAPLWTAASRSLPAARPAQQRQRRFVQDPGPGPPGPFQQQMCKVHCCLAALHVLLCAWFHGAIWLLGGGASTLCCNGHAASSAAVIELSAQSAGVLRRSSGKAFGVISVASIITEACDCLRRHLQQRACPTATAAGRRRSQPQALCVWSAHALPQQPASPQGAALSDHRLVNLDLSDNLKHILHAEALTHKSSHAISYSLCAGASLFLQL